MAAAWATQIIQTILEIRQPHQAETTTFGTHTFFFFVF